MQYQFILYRKRCNSTGLLMSSWFWDLRYTVQQSWG